MIVDRADAEAVSAIHNAAMSRVIDAGGSPATVARRLRLAASWLLESADKIQPGIVEKTLMQLDAEIAALLMGNSKHG